MATANQVIRGMLLSMLMLGTSSHCAAGDGRFPRLERWRQMREGQSAPEAGTTGAAREAEAPASGGGTDRDDSIAVDGRQRTFYLHLPSGMSPSGSYPLVFNFHGGRGDGRQQAGLSRMNTLADRYGFVVVYPDGIEKNWNDGRGTTEPSKMGIDDVKFVRALFEKLKATYPIDAKRVYSTGISNGGMFSYRLACDMSDVFAAIGPVVGSLASKHRPNCKPTSPVAVVSIMGDADEFVPLQGGEEGWKNGKGDGGQLESEASMKDFWAKHNGCSTEPLVSQLPSRVDDGTSVKKTVYSACRNGADVVFYTIAGGGHTWPPYEFKSFLLNRMAGKSSQNIDASQVIWDFFSRHPKP